MSYISIEFNRNTELRTNNILKAQEHIYKEFPGNKIYGVPVAAFGIAHTFYIDNNKYANSRDWLMENECGIIIYADEDNAETRERVERAKKNFIRSKVIKHEIKENQN